MKYILKTNVIFFFLLIVGLLSQTNAVAQSDLSKKLATNGDFINFYKTHKILKKEIFSGISTLSKEEKASLKKRLEEIAEKENSESERMKAINYSYEKFSEHADNMEISIDKFTPQFPELRGLGAERKKTITDAFGILDIQNGDVIGSNGIICDTIFQSCMGDAVAHYSAGVSACSSKNCKASAKKLLMEHTADCIGEWSSCK